MNIEDKELAQLQRSQRRKDIIKNITIVFLLILLALTFFSRTIMNYTLPEVSTHIVAQGEVSPRIRGQGTAEVDDPYTVTVTQARTIRSVAVHVDQEIKRGDVIYYLEDNEPEELTNARQELADQQANFTKRIFDGSLSDSDITRLRAGNYRSEDQMQSELASVNRRLESATREAASANAALEKLNAQSSDSGTDSGTDVPPEGGGSDVPGTDTTGSAATDEIEGEDDYGESDVASTSGTYQDGYLEIMKTSSEKKIEKATNRKIDAEAELEKAKTEQEKVVSSISAELELKSIRDAINQAQAKVDKLEKENIGATVVSPVDGTVTSLSYTAGETTSPDSAAAIIRIDGKKLTVSFSATKEQAQKLKTGDEAQPVNPWEYDDDFKAVLRQITADSSDPQNSRLLKFEIDSDAVTAGDSVSLQIAESTKTYDLVVPNAAVRQDSNGFYVLLLQVRQSPLGNRYIVAREGIKVLAKDDTNSAISGSIGAYSYVITTSTRMVTSGDQVRLANDVEVEDSY
ncbi:MAG: HlyD family efflux transporter periplasmic adaptor subunit [Lachnospiraceae bacterium]|nr:HlyD family efflux transporter periplasmic adaptor subunit [Sarcina sp.]MBR2729409.1 HlyD family efflux transporter periplasmic adaptor subunit [Lachnospiraceae bacterium]